MTFTFSQPDCDIFIPDGKRWEEAIATVTHMAVGAHQDDLEIMSLHGVLECFGSAHKRFMGVVMADGAGSPRDGVYAGLSDEAMQAVRLTEQRKAASVGDYAACVQLRHKSADIKNKAIPGPAEDLIKLLMLARPKVLYTHNLADKHDTHVAVALRTIEAVRAMPKNERPDKLYACEVWRGLDWLRDEDKTVFDVSGRGGLANALVGVFDSQVAGGKRYDLAAAGRRRANATFLASHFVDNVEEAIYGLDMTPLIRDDAPEPLDFIKDFINRFAEEVTARITKLS